MWSPPSSTSSRWRGIFAGAEFARDEPVGNEHEERRRGARSARGRRARSSPRRRACRRARERAIRRFRPPRTCRPRTRTGIPDGPTSRKSSLPPYPPTPTMPVFISSFYFTLVESIPWTPRRRLSCASASGARSAPARPRSAGAVHARCSTARDRRRHQRHLHRGGRAAPRAAGRSPPERIVGVETGGCPHTAIREDASINMEAVERLARRFPPSIRSSSKRRRQSRGDLQPRALDWLFVIDVAGGDKIPRKGGPGITKSDLLVINKIDLAPMVGRLARGDGSRLRGRCGRAALRLHEPGERTRPRAA